MSAEVNRRRSRISGRSEQAVGNMNREMNMTLIGSIQLMGSLIERSLIHWVGFDSYSLVCSIPEFSG